jgi:apolipoprotein N-acyltransferase
MGYSPGTEPALLNIDDKLIAPLICFEVISPELAAASVRAGGQLLVNINDLAWFHKSIIGDQMIACAVLRAVENRRDVIFAANTGPSAVISSLGQIKSYIGQNKAANLIANFNYSSTLTLFTRCFVF